MDPLALAPGARAALAARMGGDLLARRLALECEQDERHFRRRSDAWHLEHLTSAGPLIRAALIASGMRARGRRNALQLRLARHTVHLRKLPGAFDGFTLLHLSDLHLDAGPDFVQVLLDRVRSVQCDACVLTGDYRFGLAGSCGPALAALDHLLQALPRPVFAVLGNHDGIALAPGLEALGAQVLLNEHRAIERAGAVLHVAGIDDAHYFRTHDLARARAGLSAEDCTVLLSHTPQPYREAEAQGFSLMLSGHTHGGQICLPGGVPVITDCEAPRALARGPWRHGALAGYTSVGCGCSMVPARFQCPPEITLHTLRGGGST